MGQEPGFTMPEGLPELQALLETEWPARRAALHGPLMFADEGEEGAKSEGADGDEGAGESEGTEEKTYDAAYVKKLRDEAAKHRLEAKEAKARAKEYEDQNKTDSEKLEERAAEAEKKATASTLELARLRVALKKGLTEQQAKRLIGDTEEDLEKDADELLDSFKSTDDESSSSSSRPRERLRPGAARSSEVEETDPAKLAAQVPRRY